jgi:hypothetical protein
VLVDSRIQEQWVLEALQQALTVPGVRLGAVAVVAGRSGSSVAQAVHRLVDVIDQRLRCRGTRLFCPVDLIAALGKPAILDIIAVPSTQGWVPDAEGAALLSSSAADVWLCLTAMSPAPTFPRVCDMGVWGLEIGQSIPAANRWAGATEVVERSNLTVARVVDYTQSSRVLYRVYGATIKNSARRNRLVTLSKAVSFFRRLLRDRTQPHSEGKELLRGRVNVLAEPATRCAPTVSAAMRLAWRLTAEVASNRWQAAAGRAQWQIGYYFAGESTDTAQRPDRLHRLVPPRDRDWADPFVIQRGGRRFIFFEEMPYQTGKGHISAIEILPNGEAGAARMVLDRPYHLSYPFVFEWNGELYMLPETAQNRTIELYRCEEFPTRWTLQKVLLEDISAFDATLWCQNGRWWLFVNVAEAGASPSEELHLYWSESPLGPWSPHPANPVVSDARHARSAGPLFMRDGVLYRPSQDCSSAYGNAVSVNRIEVLDLHSYREVPVSRIHAGWYPDMLGLHTFSAAGAMRVIDYKVRRSRWGSAAAAQFEICPQTTLTQAQSPHQP